MSSPPSPNRANGESSRRPLHDSPRVRRGPTVEELFSRGSRGTMTGSEVPRYPMVRSSRTHGSYNDDAFAPRTRTATHNFDDLDENEVLQDIDRSIKKSEEFRMISSASGRAHKRHEQRNDTMTQIRQEMHREKQARARAAEEEYARMGEDEEATFLTGSKLERYRRNKIEVQNMELAQKMRHRANIESREAGAAPKAALASASVDPSEYTPQHKKRRSAKPMLSGYEVMDMPTAKDFRKAERTGLNALPLATRTRSASPDRSTREFLKIYEAERDGVKKSSKLGRARAVRMEDVDGTATPMKQRIGDFKVKAEDDEITSPIPEPTNTSLKTENLDFVFERPKTKRAPTNQTPEAHPRRSTRHMDNPLVEAMSKLESSSSPRQSPNSHTIASEQDLPKSGTSAPKTCARVPSLFDLKCEDEKVISQVKGLATWKVGPRLAEELTPSHLTSDDGAYLSSYPPADRAVVKDLSTPQQTRIVRESTVPPTKQFAGIIINNPEGKSVELHPGGKSVVIPEQAASPEASAEKKAPNTTTGPSSTIDATNEQKRAEFIRHFQAKLNQEDLDRKNLEQKKLKQEMLKQELLKQSKLKQEKLEQKKLKQEKLEQESLKQENLDRENAAVIEEGMQSVNLTPVNRSPAQSPTPSIKSPETSVKSLPSDDDTTAEGTHEGDKEWIVLGNAQGSEEEFESGNMEVVERPHLGQEEKNGTGSSWFGFWRK